MDKSNSSTISFFIPNLGGGGAEKVVVNLANAMVDLTNRPIHIVLVSAKGVFISQLRPEIKIVNLERDRVLRSLFQLVRYLRHERPSVLCSSLNYANVVATVAKLIAGNKCHLVLREDSIVQNPRGSFAEKINEWILQCLMKVFYRYANCIIAISNGVSISLQNHNICKPYQIRVIGNPIIVDNTINFNLVKSENHWNNNFIISVGRLAWEKGFDILINAFHYLSSDNLDLVILGEGPLRNDLEGLAQSLGLDKRVHFLGFVKNPTSIIKDSQALVLSSRWEGFGNVLVEALAIGIPVISTDCPGGPREILLDGSIGYLVEPENPRALALAINEALVAPRGTREMRIQRANDFAAHSIARKYLKYAFCLKN